LVNEPDLKDTRISFEVWFAFLVSGILSYWDYFS
jgi:hypothetical protein